MGLPLFVAPVESDLPKTARKTTSSSPPRSAIRRLAHISAARERASLNRRARALEHHERQYPSPRTVDSASPIDVAIVARYISMGFMNPSDLARHDRERDERRTELIGNMEVRFGPGWRNRDWENPQQDLSSEWWVLQPRLHLDGTARLTRLVGRPDPPRSIRPRHIEIIPSLAWSNPSPSDSRTNSRTESSRVSPLSGLHRERPVPRRPPPTDVNGLGDRERSLSPEGWDTLLTTLAPDPQPPSASSSFVSTAASQSAGASSNTSMSGQPTLAESAPEPPCDSGCESSDSEENELRPIRRSTSQRLLSFRNLEFHVRDATRDASTRDLRPREPIFTTYWRPPRSSQTRSGGPGSEAPVRTGAWLGFFGEASDEESSADRSRASHENSAGAGRNAPPDEEDWAERIMQTLVNREDLPHEWFTETGAIRLERQRRG